ncbi:MAG: isoquinoline 1-oxidoreductase subunit beta [Nevskiales bacterium]
MGVTIAVAWTGALTGGQYTSGRIMAISRRAILVSGLATGGGLVVWAFWRGLDDGQAARKFARSTPDAVALNGWVKIEPNGVVVCGVHRAEMGQGISTAVPMLIAEELDVDWEQVRFEFTPVDRDYFNFGVLMRGQPFGDTAGRPLAQLGERAARAALHAIGMSITISSASVVDAWDTVRLAAAQARALLLAAAARRWGVPAERLETLHGQVLDRAGGRSAGYGELVAAAATGTPPAAVRPKDPAAFRLLGRSPPRLDLPAKVTGSAAFGVDAVLPAQLFATVRHSPLLNTRVAGIDNLAEVSGMRGVEGVVRLGDRAVAVVARDTWSALRGAARLSLRSEPSDRRVPDSESIMAEWREAQDDAVVFRDEGDAAAGLATTGLHAEAAFELPYLAHLCMEPMSCAARVGRDEVTVWAPTQALSLARDVAAEVAGVAADRVTVHRTFLGGGFGRRAEVDFVAHAVGAAMAFPGRPVKLVFSREEDVRADMYRPAAFARVRGALDERGRIHTLDYQLVSQSVMASFFRRTPTPRGGDPRKDAGALAGALGFIYGGVANLRIAFLPRDPGVPVGYWRSVGSSHNCFAVESFMDELAALAGQDPVAFRLAHLDGRPAHQAVLREVARRAGWGGQIAAGRGRGVALIESHDSIVAQVVEVVAQERGEISVERVTCVIDPRTVIHPDTVIAQMQGAIVDGLAAALYGGITIRGGAVEQGNFDDCRFLRLSDTPSIDVHLLPQGGRPGGVGEPGLPAVAPALANAIFAATGQRVRRLPIAGFRPTGVASDRRP